MSDLADVLARIDAIPDAPKVETAITLFPELAAQCEAAEAAGFVGLHESLLAEYETKCLEHYRTHR